MTTHHDTFLDVLLAIRHANFESFDAGTMSNWVNRDGKIIWVIIPFDGNVYEAEQPTEDSPGWKLKEV